MVDPREKHIRALAKLMRPAPGLMPSDGEEFLQHREYGLALEALADAIQEDIDGRRQDHSGSSFDDFCKEEGI